MCEEGEVEDLNLCVLIVCVPKWFDTLRGDAPQHLIPVLVGTSLLQCGMLMEISGCSLTNQRLGGVCVIAI